MRRWIPDVSVKIFRKKVDWLAFASLSGPGFSFFELQAKRNSLLINAVGSAFLAATIIAGVQTRRNRQIAPSPKPISLAKQADALLSKASLKLRASGCESWVLLEDLDGGKILDAPLEPCHSKLLSINSGLRVRSGRPDLLMIEVDKTASRPLGRVVDMRWFYFRP